MILQFNAAFSILHYYIMCASIRNNTMCNITYKYQIILVFPLVSKNSRFFLQKKALTQYLVSLLATSPVESKLGLEPFSRGNAEEATVKVGEWITGALAYLLLKCILKSQSLILGGLAGGGTTISVLWNES